MKWKKIAALFLSVLFCLCAFSCSEPNEKDTGSLYENIVLDQYVRLGAYTDLDVVRAEGQTRGEAVWDAVMAESEILGYPEHAVVYYVLQSKERCRYYAEEEGISYEEALTALGTSDAQMRADAEALVASDLVYRAVREDAQITLTESEKAAHFDRYVDRFVRDWGYEREELTGRLSELVYDAMLYDKTTEYLILHNCFEE